MRGDEKARSRRRRIVTRVLVGVVLLVVAVPVVRLAYPLLPAYAQASCTVTSPSERQGGYRSRDFFPSIGTDCGSFAAEREVACAADPSRTVPLVSGVTYDLTVAGPRVPLLSQPTVLSAQVSDVQARVPDMGIDAELGDDAASDNLRSLHEQFSVEGLRAFDYEQPPYDPQCDPYRMLMTDAGVQMVPPARAEQLLQAPDGVTPRDPKLPCEGYHCREQ